MKKDTVKYENPEENDSPMLDPASLPFELCENCILADQDLKTLCLGEKVVKALGDIKHAVDLCTLLPSEDSFCLEEFACNAPEYRSISTLEVKICGVGSYSYALAVRREMFGKQTVLLTLFQSKRELLLDEGVMYSKNSPCDVDTSFITRLRNTRTMIDSLADNFPDEARFIGATFSELVRRSLAGSIICAVLSCDTSRIIFGYDPTLLAESVIEQMRRLCGANVCSDVVGPMNVDPGIPEEHMWYLMSCALTTALRLGSHGSTVMSVKLRSKDTLRIAVSAPRSGLSCALPEHITIGELRSVLPKSSMRLYLCDLICEEYGALSDVRITSDIVEISFEFTLRDRTKGLHRREHTFTSEYPEFVTEMLILPDDET